MDLADDLAYLVLLKPSPEAKFVVGYHIAVRRLVQRNDGVRFLA